MDFTCIIQGRGVEILPGQDVQKPVNANPGLKVDRGINFSCLKMLFTSYLLCNLRLL